MYVGLGDPRESVLKSGTPGFLEADNRVEPRYQWGAQILDLCGLSPEDYKNSTAITVKTILDCGDCSGSGSTPINMGTGTISEDGLFTFSFASAASSNVYVFVKFKDSAGQEQSFKTMVSKGTNSASVDITEYSTLSPYAITDIKLGFEEDGSDAGPTATDKKYEYDATFEGDVAGKTYLMSILCTKTDDLTPEDFLTIIETQGGAGTPLEEYVASYDEIEFTGDDVSQEATFYALCSYVTEPMTEKEEEEYFKEHSYDFVFLTQKTIDEIKEDFTTDTNNWSRQFIELNGTEFNMWVRRDLSGALCPYAVESEGQECQDYDPTFTLIIKE